jgi:NADPH2:quinone reductase
VKAIVISAYGGPEVLAVAELPDPVPAAGEVLIRAMEEGAAACKVVVVVS